MSDSKRLAGEKAIEYVEDGSIVGVGTGSTVAYFIDALARIRGRIEGAASPLPGEHARAAEVHRQVGREHEADATRNRDITLPRTQ